MKILTAFLTFSLLIASCSKAYIPRSIQSVDIIEFPMEASSIRAITTQADSLLYYATSDGKIGILTPEFKKLNEITVKEDSITPHFRAIASNGSVIYALSIGNPALLYRYQDGKATLVYREDHPAIFYDAMRFYDDQNGLAIGDPTDGCLSVIVTHDGGQTWKKIPCDNIPSMREGEAAFAASNGNIATIGSEAWVATGGTKSRIFYSNDYGETWTVRETPMMAGGKMTGSYAVAFHDRMNGLLVGGDWDKKEDQRASKAKTTDGGKTWSLVSPGKGPGYRSSVQYVPGTQGKEVFSVSSTGISYSNDAGNTWTEVSNQGYYSIRFVNKNFAWLSGNNKIAKMTLSIK
ncbi:oxidoreductase [Flavobacteriaceae bacterium F08102]|nr:oxidoreductase [Flavobacteriaceae bacterium F08102]